MKKHLVAFLILLLASQLHAQQEIRINQLGYYPSAKKIAVLVGDTKEGRFYLVRENTRDTVFKANLGGLRSSMNSSLKTRIVDFSSFSKSGKYRLYIPGVGTSYPFSITKKVNAEAAKAVIKGFYYQRVSMPLESRYAGNWSRAAGHPDTEVLVHPSAASAPRPAGTMISSPGGWYDAGDYNKYIVNSGITMGTLFSAYEDFRNYFDTLQLNIPESNDRIPDLLNEAIYNLRWMLTMQDPNDGGVYHKCTNAAFDGMVMPGVTKLPRYVVQKGTAATLDFAAVMAQASRILERFRRQLPGLSDSCRSAATSAYQWAIAHPNVIYDQNAMNSKYEPKVTTGAYGDRDFRDEFFWAAAELLITTREPAYLQMINQQVKDSMVLPSWANVRMMGVYSLLRYRNQLPAPFKDNVASLSQRFINFSNQYIQAADKSAFNTIMGCTTRDFVWGSNAVAANQSMLLINAYLLTGDKKYAGYALTNLDYILGRNATGYCFITGFGARSPMHPHHRPSIADGIAAPVPGLLAGGPNPGRQDNCKYEFTEPETAYTDLDCSYASNEIAINWNAPLVYVANAMEAMNF